MIQPDHRCPFSFFQFVFFVQKLGHCQIIDILRLIFEEFGKTDGLALVGSHQFQGHQIANLVIQRHDDGEIAALPGDDLGSDKAGAADLAVEPIHGIFSPLLHGKGDGILRQGAIGLALVGNTVAVVFQFLQVAGLDHLRHGGTYIKIAQALILITQLIDLLHVHRVADPGHDEENQNLHIQHIVNKSKSAHILHLLGLLYRSFQKNQAPL